MKLSLLFLLALILGAIFVGPQKKEPTHDDEQEIAQTDLGLHAESSDRLVAIMQTMSLSISSNVDDGITVSEDELDDLIEAVEELQFYAELMTIKIPTNELEENQAVIFSAMANQLYDEALNIRQLANSYDPHMLDSQSNRLLYSSFERMSRTCSACHQLFRDH